MPVPLELLCAGEPCSAIYLVAVCPVGWPGCASEDTSGAARHASAGRSVQIRSGRLVRGATPVPSSPLSIRYRRGRSTPL